MQLYDTIFLSAVGIMSMYVCMYVCTFFVYTVCLYMLGMWYNEPTPTHLLCISAHVCVVYVSVYVNMNYAII